MRVAYPHALILKAGDIPNFQLQQKIKIFFFFFDQQDKDL